MDSILRTSHLEFKDFISYPDVEIPAGKGTFITGKSGIGKSVLLRLFNGTLSPSSGTVFYKGQDTLELDTIDLRREILLTGQSAFLFDKTIKENFAEYYGYRNQEPPSYKKIEEYLHICCMDFPLDKNCLTLSGGEKQRIFIAICLSFLPKVLLLDEPTSALDQKNSIELMTNLLKFAKGNGISVVTVSHDSSIVQRFSDKTIEIGGQAYERND